MQWYSWMHTLPFHRVLFTIASHFLNFPPKAVHAMVFLNANPSLWCILSDAIRTVDHPRIQYIMMQFVGDKVSESEGLEVAESDVEVSESGGERQVSESEPLVFSESDVEVSESGGIGKFPNPRAWKFPNPALKFPNPGGSASFRIRGPGSFRIRGPRSFRIRGPRSFRIRGPGSFRIRGPGSFRIRRWSFRIRGTANFRIRGPGVSESAAEVSESDVGPTDTVTSSPFAGIYFQDKLLSHWNALHSGKHWYLPPLQLDVFWTTDWH